MLYFTHKTKPVQLKLNPPCLGYTDRVLKYEKDFIEIERWLHKMDLSINDFQFPEFCFGVSCGLFDSPKNILRWIDTRHEVNTQHLLVYFYSLLNVDHFLVYLVDETRKITLEPKQ